MFSTTPTSYYIVFTLSKKHIHTLSEVGSIGEIFFFTLIRRAYLKEQTTCIVLVFAERLYRYLDTLLQQF